MISVILIFFNAERFIEEAIESVFAQEYSDWELLLVDDGSNDHSTDIALGWVKKFPHKLRYFSHPGGENRGMSASRNLGIQESRGEYITFLDADDVWTPQAISTPLKLLESHPRAGLIYGPTQWWYSWSGLPDDLERDFIQPLGVTSNQLIEPPLLLETTLLHEAYNPAGILWRRDIIAHIGGYEEQFRGMFEDQACYSKALIATPVYVSSECWYRYRKHDDGCCSQSVIKGQYARERAAFLRWLRRYLRDSKSNTTKLRRLVNRQLLRCRYPRLEQALALLAQKKQRLSEVLGSCRRNTASAQTL